MGIILSIFRPAPPQPAPVISHPYPLGAHFSASSPDGNRSHRYRPSTRQSHGRPSHDKRLSHPPSAYHSPYNRSHAPTATTIRPLPPLAYVRRSSRIRPLSFLDDRPVNIGGGADARGWGKIQSSDETSSISLSAHSSPPTSPSPLDSFQSASVPTVFNKLPARTEGGGYDVEEEEGDEGEGEESLRTPVSPPTSVTVTSSSNTSSSMTGKKGKRWLLRTPSLGSSNGTGGSRWKGSRLKKIKRVEDGWDLVRDGDWRPID